ncbi:MAG: hypothetical protein ABJC39_10400 [Chloroflexota bacterium]
MVILSPGSVEEDAGSIAGLIPLAAVGLDSEALAARGWQMSRRGLEREWPVRSAVDRSAVLRDVDDAIDILSDRRGLTRANVPLVHVAPLSSDAGFFQVGCVVALLSAVVGDVVGTAALLVLHPEWLFREGDAIATIVGGLVTGWLVALVVAIIASLIVVGVGLMSLIERMPRLSRSSGDIFLVLMIFVPAVIAAITLWFTASLNR